MIVPIKYISNKLLNKFEKKTFFFPLIQNLKKKNENDDK